MSGEQPPHGPLSSEDIFQDIRHRRLGIIKALTTDLEEFSKLCDPDNVVDLSLYGLSDGGWTVGSPCDEVPPNLPEPASGINFVRDSMPKREWVEDVALHSDVWLLRVAFFMASIKGLGRDDRRDLFSKINGMSTILDDVRGTWNLKADGIVNISNKNNSKMKQIEAGGKNSEDKTQSKAGGKNSEDKTQSKENMYEVCNKGKSQTKWFSINCDTCKWFHGRCVSVTPERSENIEFYECPLCSNRK